MNNPLKVIQLYNHDKRRDEVQLIKKARQNNRKAQHVLYKWHAPKMLSVCRYYISDVQQAEEVMLNGFFKVFTKLKSFNGKGSFEGWIRRIMVREAISFLRKQKKIEFATDQIETHGIQFNNIKTNIDIAEIQQLIDGLPEGYRIVFVMYAIEGYKHSEIATLLEINEGTSKSQLFKARQLLQKQLTIQNTINYGTNEI